MSWCALPFLKAPPVWRCLILSLALLPAVVVAADERPPACTAELAALDQSFVAAMARLLVAGTEKARCAALANQIDALGKSRDVHVHCLPPGDQRDAVLAMLAASARDFRQAQLDLGCKVTAATGGQA